MSSSSVQNSSLKVSVFVFGLIAFVNSQIEANNGNGENKCDIYSHCVAITRCPQVLALLVNKTPLPDNIVTKLRKLHCGWETKNPKVCCNNVEGAPKDEFSNSNTNVIVTKYSGINLFPNEMQCGHPGLDGNRILGGDQTVIDEFPWMALLAIQKGNSHRYHCGGSLINNRYVITAAHCVKDHNLKHVRLGEWDLANDTDCVAIGPTYDCNDPPIDVPIEKVIVHPNYRIMDHSNDIALLRLAQRIKFTDWISPICMPFSSKLRRNEYKDDRLTISGWGKTETRQKSLKKLKLEMPIEDFELCRARYKQANVTLTNKQMCAGGQLGKDSCSGDSGGPLMKLVTDDPSRWYIAGITSYGPSKCATSGWPGIYTRVGSYIDWILSQVEE